MTQSLLISRNLQESKCVNGDKKCMRIQRAEQEKSLSFKLLFCNSQFQQVHSNCENAMPKLARALDQATYKLKDFKESKELAGGKQREKRKASVPDKERVIGWCPYEEQGSEF